MPEDRVTEGALPPNNRELPEHAWAKGPRLSLLGDARRRRLGGGNSVGGLESQTPGKDARRHDRGGLENELRAERRSAGRDQAAAAAADKRSQRGRNRGDAERARQRFPRSFQVAAGAEEQSLDRRHGDAEHLGDLDVAAILDLAHHDRGALIERQPRERVQDLVERRPLVIPSSRLACALERNLLRPAAGLAPAHATDVVSDLDQPVVRGVRPLAVLERAIGVQERLLRHVLGVGRIREHGERVLVDLGDVLSVEALEGPVGRVVAPSAQRSQVPQRLGCPHGCVTPLLPLRIRPTPWPSRASCSAGGSPGRARRAPLP